MEFRPVRFEVGLTPSRAMDCGELASTLGPALASSGAVVTALPAYDAPDSSGGEKHWRLSPSPTKRRLPGNNRGSDASSSSSSSFRLVSPWTGTDEGIAHRARVLRRIEAGENPDLVRTNVAVGLRLHVCARGMSFQALVRLCQLFVKYEDVLDTLVPASRRTGSETSKKFFRSNRLAIPVPVPRGSRGSAGATKQRIGVIDGCSNTEGLIELVSPDGSCYKLNLRNVNNNRFSTASYIEFRQHSATTDARKLRAWAALCNALVERALTISETDAPLAFRSSRTPDEQFETLLTSVLKNPDMRAYYRGRRAELTEGGATENTPSPPQRQAAVAAASATGASLRSRDSATEASRRRNPSKKAALCGCCFAELDPPSPNGSSMAKIRSCACQERGHTFCASCIRRYAEEELFANQGSRLTCLAMGGSCQSEFNSRQLYAVLSPNLQRKLREAQFVADANAAGNTLCECPRCGCKGTVAKKAKTFSCPSGSCRYHFCRSCGEEAHPKLKCSEVERKIVTNARTSVEEAMSGALVRHCPQCRTAVVKSGGCNEMRCSSCGTRFCYACRSGACGGHCSSTSQERDEVRDAGNSSLRRVDDANARSELAGLVSRLM